jgi:YHS domain-containing protein
MGFAKAAELNHYPGPKHVLELADHLRLSEEQRRKTQAVFEEMNSKAVNLGKQLIEKEQLLDSRFADANISDAKLAQLVSGADDEAVHGIVLIRPGDKEEKNMAKDPVCGMDVEVQKAEARSQYAGQSYFFCSKSCKEKFDRNPEQYAK